MKKKIKIFDYLFIIFIFYISITSFSLSKYFSKLSNSTEAIVAKWNNNIELVGSKNLELMDNDTASLKFNVLSNSDTTTKYDLYINNIPSQVEMILKNKNKNIKYSLINNIITVGFNINNKLYEVNININDKSKEIVFDNNIIVNILVKDNEFKFSNNINNEEVIVNTLNTGNNIVFNNFDIIDFGNKKLEHELILTGKDISFVENNITIKALFVQVD